MFFLSISPLVLNIAHPDMRLWGIIGKNRLFLQNSSEKAYLMQSKHIKACKPEYVKDCEIWSNSCQEPQQPNSRVNKSQIAILK